MLGGRTVFAQLMTHVSQKKFQTCVARYHGDYKASRLSCWDQYLCMAFAQLTYRESLRDIEACLRAVQPRPDYPDAAEVTIDRLHEPVAGGG